MEHLIFPLIVLVILAISKGLAGKGAQQEFRTPKSNLPPPNKETEEERLRRFMEAVGLPQGSTPAPTIRQRTSANPAAPLRPIAPPAAGLPNTPTQLRRVPPIAAPAPVPAYTRRARQNPSAVPPPIPAPVAQQAPVLAQAPAAPTPGPTLVETIAEIKSRATPASRPSPAPQPILATSLLTRLRDPLAVREAMILREVLGPPKAFQIL